MNIGIDARALTNKPSGIGIYLGQILKYINENDSENTYFLYSHKDIILPCENSGRFILRPYKAKISTIKLHYCLGKIFRKDKLDVFWGPMHILPKKQKGIRYVVTVHDLALIINKRWGRFQNVLMQNLFVKNTCKSADRVLASSKATKIDIEQIFKVPDSKISVVYLGGLQRIPILADNQDKNLYLMQEIIKKYDIKKGQYFLFIGTIEPRKNILTIVKAFERYHASCENSYLVLAGGLGWKYNQIIDYINQSNAKEKIIMPGYITEDEKDVLLANAKAFVFPSHYEGFGIPVLEALGYGIPVITSNISSLPEVGGNAAFYLNNVESDEELTMLMHRVDDLSQKDKNKRLALSKEQVVRFSWNKCAKETYEILLNSR